MLGIGISVGQLCDSRGRRTSVKIGFSFIGVLGLIVAGCSSTGGVDGPVLTSPAELFGASGGMAAEVTGVLVYDESANCLLMELEGVQYPLVWPGGNEVA